MALADQVWMAFVIGAVVLAFSGTAGSQLFAAVHDDLQTTASPVADAVVSIVRMALTAGWVVGPVLGSILATAAGSRVMLAATGACTLAQIGAVIGIQPLIELILMPVAVVVARRTGMMHLMILGAAFGVGANLCFALTGDAAGMFAGQILMGGVWGVFAALGIIVAQRLLPQAVATASAIFISSTAIASALGGLTGSLGVSLLGLPHVFFAPALYGLLATSGIAVMSRSRFAVH
jgi:hypothetical protein